MKKFRPLILITILLGTAVFMSVRLVSFQIRNVPPEFISARDRGALLASEIVDLSRQSLTRLAQIAEFDQERKFNQALALISEELIEYQKSQDTAARLASQLEIMARLLPEIKPSRAREIAAEGVSAEVALVSRLVTYNDKLRDLFVVLQLKFNTRNVSGELDGRVNELINKINEQAKAINQFNKRFDDAMAEFDTIFK
jgi:hypothetical protein